MNTKSKRELEEFRRFKINYTFVQKDLIVIEKNTYCEGELVNNEDFEKPIGFSDKLINVGYKLKGPYSKVLSNLFPYKIKFRNITLNSIEGFFQGIKFKDKKAQNLVFKYSGLDSNNIKVASAYDWKESGLLYWQGKPINRFGKDYELLIDELYIAALQNPLYRGVLKTCDKPIIHSIGENDSKKTVFTRYEFEHELNCLREFVQSNK
jgi:hypothetical protein